MSINYQLVQEGPFLTAILRNIEIPETLNSIGYSPSFCQRGSEQKLKFETCILPTISDIFATTSPNVTHIEVNNSIIDRIDMKILKKFTKLEELSFINSTLNEVAGTIFGSLRNFTIKFEKDEGVDEAKVAVVDGKINLDELDDEDAGDQASGSIQGQDSIDCRRQIIKLKSKTAKTFGSPVSTASVAPLYQYQLPSSSNSIFGTPVSNSSGIFGQPASTSKPLTFGTSVFGSTNQSSAAPDQSSSPKRTCDSQSEQRTSKLSLDHRTNLKEKYTKSQTINANLSKDLEVLRDQVMKLEAENKKLKDSGILADLKKIYHDEAFKDFTINVNKEKSFKVHKLLFAARSSVIADMIRNNFENFELNLQDIPLPIFEILLHFIYNDSAPENDENLIATYAAAGRLDIKDLKNLTALRLMDKVDDKNAFKILELSNRYGNDELRLKAFEEIRKVLSDYQLKDDFSKKPEKIKILMDMKRKMDEEFEKMQQEFEGIQVTGDDQQETTEGESDIYEIDVLKTYKDFL